MTNRRKTSAQPVKRKHTTENGVEKQLNKKRKVSHSSHGSVPGCALTLGEGDTGQLGLGPDTLDRVKPAVVPDLPNNIIQVTAGGMHSVCLTASGEVYTFGCNDEGALGRDTSEEGSETCCGKVDLKEKVVQVSAGDSHTAALTDNGRVFMWGTFRDASGRIGLTPDGESHKKPTLVYDAKTVSKITSGSDHVVLLTEEGEIITFGNAEQGQLGRVSEYFSMRGGRKGLDLLLSPAKVHFKRKSLRFTDIWSGTYVTFAQAQGTGEIYAWGLNNYFQLGFADMMNRFVPDKVKAFDPKDGWKDISGGQHHTLALDGKGRVFSLGRKEYGRLGLGEDCEEAKSPTLIPGLADVQCQSVNCGEAVSFATAQDGSLYAWGMGTSKQLAQRDDDDLYEPTLMTGKQLENRRGLMVSAGGQHTILLAKDK